MNNNDLESREVRFDVRGKGGKIVRVRICERTADGKFRPLVGDFSKTDAQYAKLFSKVATAVAKSVAPPFNAAEIVETVNAPRRDKKKVAPKLRGRLTKLAQK